MRRDPKSSERVVYLFEGRRLEPNGRRPLPGEFSYSRLKAESGVRPPEEKRGLRRLRTKLRSGTIVDRNFRSLAECLIHDRTEAGARLRLMVDRPIPTRFTLIDNVSGLVKAVELVWRRGREVGVRARPEYHPWVSPDKRSVFAR